MVLIGFTGKARSGKNTAGAFCARAFGFTEYAMAGPLKAMLDVGLGLDARHFQTTEEKEAVIPWLGVSYRHTAQTLGTEWGRERVNQDLWLLVAEQVIERHRRAGCPGIVITDIRFENEAAMVRRLGGTVVHVLSDCAQSGMLDASKSHASERGVAIGPYDRVLRNYGTIEALERGTADIINSLVMTAGVA